ncbi:MAG: hypothetical protein MSC31_08070 [Solirubrobacteraceae bacterium MAG38_C4-C5]|nr:hypothetical protein [Candidatus Siliceabacter maunaloa]
MSTIAPAPARNFRFEVAGRSAIVRIKQELLGFQYDYRLVVDGAEIP